MHLLTPRMPGGSPWPTGAWLLACVGVTLVIVAIVTALTFTLS